MAKVSRKELLGRLLAVDAGVVKGKSFRQSDCVVLKAGRFYTMSNEVSCSIPSGLDSADEGAVDAGLLADLLKGLPDDELEVWVGGGGGVLTITGSGRRRSRLTLQQEIVLPEMPREEFPRKELWAPLHEDFAAAADVAHRCTKKKDDFAKECVHVHPEFLEASDNARAVRFPVPTFVTDSALVRGTTLKHMIQLGMTAACATPSWLHFRNPAGLRMSLKKFALESYPPLGDYFKLRGRPVKFPAGLAAAAKLAGLFPDDEGDVEVHVGRGKVTVVGSNAGGDYREEAEARYNGPDMDFVIPPKLLAELTEKDTDCEVTDCSVRVDGGNYIYVCALELRPCSVATAETSAGRKRSTAASAATSTPAPKATTAVRRS